MSPELLEIITPPLAILTFGGLFLIGMKIRYSHIQRTRLGGAAHQDVERLTAAVDTLQDQLRVMRDEILHLNERVEFTERLLERPRAAATDSDALPGQRD
ncbi:MAG: hypothetical protein JSV41_13320 [Gemmatimonadota bacterium]|nr:MAG: hypothetical protein JSV41_13320 [Gemmatimonadota bacterium]